MTKRLPLKTIEVKTPDTGITVTLKIQKSYGDSKQIYQAVFGDRPVSSGTTDVTYAQAQSMVDITVKNAVIGWDLTEEDGSAVPVTPEEIEKVFTDKDVQFLMEHINEAAPDPKV